MGDADPRTPADARTNSLALSELLMDTPIPIRRALLSVSDKRGLLELAEALVRRGVHLLASGGTRTALADAGFDVTEVSA